MTTPYAICFDFPDVPGEPLFAGRYKDTLGFADRLETAVKFETEEAAQRTLENAYGPSVAMYGVVVEVSS